MGGKVIDTIHPKVLTPVHFQMLQWGDNNSVPSNILWRSLCSIIKPIKYTSTVWIKNLATKGNVYKTVLVEDILTTVRISSTSRGAYVLPLVPRFLIHTV